MFISWALNIIMQAAFIGYLDAACIMMRGRKSGAAAPEELGEFPKYFAPELVARKTKEI
ncbi:MULTISPECIES: hypothetical protein [unclassified Escherichia]|uniref:hypothetical protein n=1 Tax=unclassified Escherichia TaxID=2608889 RepID=UPI0013EEBF04|nr:MULTISPECIES: hypothetical protein [unclassified Escherichia]